MKLFPAITMLLCACLCACTQDAEKKQVIKYIALPVQSPSLVVRPTLQWIPSEKKMELSVDFRNVDRDTVTIKEVSVENTNGLRSTVPISVEGNLFIASGDRNFMRTRFTHVNDKKLFHQTGLLGMIDSSYSISVFYTIRGKENMRRVNATATIPVETFVAYQKTSAVPVQIYTLGDDGIFEERQREYHAEKTRAMPSSSFVHLTAQEVAISGFNFRVNSFHLRDSVYVKIFAINHSGVELAIDLSTLAIALDEKQISANNILVTANKVTGVREKSAELGKGERMAIELRTKTNDAPNAISVKLSKAFLLRNAVPLFHDDIRLSRSSTAFHE